MLCKLRADDACAHGNDLRIIGFCGALHGIGVMGQGRTNARHLVGRNANANARAAKQDAAFVFTIDDGPGQFCERSA